MVNAQELEAQRQRLGLEAEVAARGVQQNGGNNQPRLVDENRGVDGLILPQRQPIAPRGRAQHPAHMMYDEDDADLDGSGAIGAIVLPALPPVVKFTITSTMIQLLNLKGMFRGVDGDDANQHLMNFVAICKSQEIPGATNWLNEMPDESIRTWNELKEAFLERFFPESKELQMKDEISTHKQLPGEAMHDTWWRFNQKLKKCPNHDLTERHLKQAFYRSLNYVTKPIVDAACGGSFMRKPFAESMQLLDEVSKNNRAWYTRDAEVGELGYTFELPADQRKREEERDQDMAHMRTQIDLLTKHIVAKSEKVNVVGQQHRYEDQDLDMDEEANYLGNQGGFRNYNFGNQGYNSGNAGRSYARDGNRDRVSGSSNGSKLEDMMAKVLQKVESTDAGVKEMRGDFSSMSQLVDSHTTSIKQIEQQLGQLSGSMNPRKNGSLPSDTIQNPKKEGHCMAIATRSGKVLSDPISAGTKYEQVDDQGEAQQSQPKAQLSRGKEKGVQEHLPLQQIPRLPPPFPQRLKNNAEDGKFTKFITMLKQRSVNIPLVEALEQMPGYVEFMKDLVTKKRAVSHDFSNDVHHCSAISTRSPVQKKEDPGAFTIPCNIGSIKFAKALCDLGASINLMPLAIYKKLGLGVRKPTSMRLMMADRSVK
ncbi:uncharacterized protein LOC125859068 [Solanum stenotomum]|uniref:uncharacterized protein LOC125859068 n=1 Tax=Solanum stenotomum TaxID=172797 RepID=UPI0020D0B3FD|nr:uncharacterized protein LOC125859068 [Solanum stenotomum]